MDDRVTILNVNGPYREPREPVFSYDYSIQRPTWPTANGVRIKVSIPEELDYLRVKILGVNGGTPGQQLILSRALTRRIADQKFLIAEEAGMFSSRLDVMVEPFTGAWEHLFPKLETWMKESQAVLRQEIRERIGL